MRASELIQKLQDLVEIHGDLYVEIDHDEFSTTLSVNDVQVLKAYIGKGKYIYIYPDNNDTNNLCSYLIDRGYEEAKKKL